MITEEQKHFYDKNGYLKIPAAFSADKMNEFIQRIECVLNLSRYRHDILFINNQPQKLLYLFDKDKRFLELLVSEPILETIKKISDNYKEIVPTWEDLVIKKPFSKTGFKPHQDLPLQSMNSNVFTIAIYLTNSHRSPVCFLPQSHQLGPLTKDELSTVCKDRKHDFAAILANKGDIIIHNSKTIHKSLNNNTNESKYTWYVEFRTLNQLLYDSPWDKDWIMKRRAIFVYALNQYRKGLLNTWCNDQLALSPYLDPIQLRVAHVTKTVDFDMKSPYYHF